MAGVGSRDGQGTPPRFDVGDRVLAARRIGGLLRARVRAGTPGVVIARGLDDHYTVAFNSSGCTEDVAGRDLIG